MILNHLNKDGVIKLVKYLIRKISFISILEAEESVFYPMIAQNSVELLKDPYESWIKKIFLDRPIPLILNAKIALPQLVFRATKKYGMQAPVRIQKSLDHVLSEFNQSKSKSASLSTSPEASDKKMKILYISGALPSVYHGGGLQLYDILSKLSVHHQVDLVSVVLMDEYKKNQSDTLKSFIHAGLYCLESEFVNLSQEAIEKALNCKISDYDVIHFEYPISLRLLPKLRSSARKMGFTFVECVTRRLVMDFESERIGTPKRFFACIEELMTSSYLEKLATNLCDFLVTLTQEDADFVSNVFQAKSHILPIGLPEEQFKEDLEKTKLPAPYEQLSVQGKVSFLGNYYHYPNVDGMLWYLEKIHPKVRRQVPSYTLDVIGAGDLSKIRKFANGDSSVNIVGEVEKLTLPLLSSRVCIAPLISGAGMRSKVNQYAYICRPIVATTIATSDLPYQNGKDMFIADDEDSFAQAVVTLLTDSKLWNQMQARSREIVEQNFLWAPIIKKLTTIYSSP